MIVRGITPAEYFELEEHSDEKHAYNEGTMFPNWGRWFPATPPRLRHKILFNVLVALETALQGVERETCAFDVAVNTENGHVPSEIVVVLGEPIFKDTNAEVIINPSLVVELLPLETAGYDQMKKFSQCHRIESLGDYLLIAQDRPRVEHYVHQPEGLWLLSEASGLEATVTLASVGCELHLSNIYRRIVFDNHETGSDET